MTGTTKTNLLSAVAEVVRDPILLKTGLKDRSESGIDCLKSPNTQPTQTESLIELN